MFKLHEMISQRKTAFAVLRQELGLSVEEFARLLQKSVSTVTKLDNGQLKLSEETAVVISQQTGVAIKWLLDGDPKDKPYSIDPGDNSRRPYSKELFEKIQARKAPKIRFSRNLKRDLVFAIPPIVDWLSIYANAAKTGQDDLALYLMNRYLDQLAKRFGKDDGTFRRLDQKVRIVDDDGSEWVLVQDTLSSWITVKDTEESSKKEPLPPSPANARRAGGRKSASPRRRHRDAQASG
jgi:transcriptional regulator with XRE-family HTH domain